MEIFQTQNNRSEKKILLPLMAFAVLLRNPSSDQRSSMADTEGKKIEKMSNTENSKNPNKNNHRKKNTPQIVFKILN